MSLIKDDRAENPIEVSLYVLLALIVMAFLVMTAGAFLDEFNVIITAVELKVPLSSWGDGILSTYLGYINYAYYIPSVFIAIVLIWGVRAVIRRQTYTTANNQTYNNTDEFE